MIFTVMSINSFQWTQIAKSDGCPNRMDCQTGDCTWPVSKKRTWNLTASPSLCVWWAVPSKFIRDLVSLSASMLAHSKACMAIPVTSKISFNNVSLVWISDKHCSTVRVLVTTIDALDTFKQDNYSTLTGYGDTGSARYELALLPPCPTIRILCYSNCQEIHPPFLSEFSEIRHFKS